MNYGACELCSLIHALLGDYCTSLCISDTHKRPTVENIISRDKIGRPNQSDTSGNHPRQAKERQAAEEVGWQHRVADLQIGRRYSSHGTQPAGVERTDEEVRHDALLRLLAELRDQGKAMYHNYVICLLTISTSLLCCYPYLCLQMRLTSIAPIRGRCFLRCGTTR